MNKGDIDFIKIAQTDNESSVILYDQEFYPQSIFNAQQAVEKLCKYLVSSQESFDKEKIKRFGHDSLQLFREFLKNFNQIYGIAHVSELKILKYLIKDFDDKDAEFQLIKSYNLQNLKPEELDFLIRELDSLERDLKSKDQKQINLSSSDFKALIQDMIKIGQISEEEAKNTLNSLEDNPLLKEVIFADLQKLFRKLPNYLNAVMRVFYLSIVFTMHSVSTRYQQKISPIEYYTLKNPLVKRLPRFNHHIKGSINTLVEVNDLQF